MGRISPYVRMCALMLAVGFAAGCATEPVSRPAVPDESLLADAESMLDEARDAGAAEFAPEPLRQARRRLASARDILYRAAAASRELNDTERERVTRLADEARLDARLALARARAGKVERELTEAQADLATPSKERRP